MAVPVSDLTPAARIRNAALEYFAADGVTDTSIHDIAEAAGVSSGLVQYYFETKAGLHRAVNEYILRLLADAFEEVGESGDGGDGFAQIGTVIDALLRRHQTVILYLARSLVDGDPEVAELFEGLLRIARAQTARQLELGALDPNADLDWATLHPLIAIIGAVLLEPLLSRQLPEPLLSDAGLERWSRASTELYRRGLAPPGRR